MKRHLLALAVAASTLCTTASAQFTTTALTYTDTEQAATNSQLSATALTAAIDRFDAATPMAHPRLFKGQTDYLGIVAATRAERANALNTAVGNIKRNSINYLTDAMRTQINSADPALRMASWWQQDRLIEGIGEAAMVYYMTKDVWFLNEMHNRMAVFGPPVLARGCTGEYSETRSHAWYFALAYDIAYASMSAADRQMARDVIIACSSFNLPRLIDNVSRYPEDGIAFQSLAKFVAALILIRGEAPTANALLAPALTTYMNRLNPWGGNDGGFSNGTSYAEWDSADSLLQWDVIERALDLPVYKKSWVAELPRFLAYALPPGTPAGAFGDGAEVKRSEDWARFGKSIMNRSTTPLSRWYAKQLSGEDYARLNILLSPREYSGITLLPTTQPQSAYFPSIGWSLMHSSLADPQRTSVYFKSSPFGSLNHSHGDQNSFVLYSKGKVLAMDSGNYDYYNSPHWRDYYKHTKAHNAITVDGGLGQGLGPLGLGAKNLNGTMTRFQQYGTYDITAGDATSAYNGLLTRAKRTVVFIRPSTLVTIDQLASNTARVFEYNLHTSVAMTGNAASFRADVFPATLCGVIASPQTLVQSSTSGYSPAPTIATTPHYANRFAFASAQTSGLIVSVLRTDCTTATPTISFVDSTGATVNAGGKVITVTDTDVTVQ